MAGRVLLAVQISDILICLLCVLIGTIRPHELKYCILKIRAKIAAWMDGPSTYDLKKHSATLYSRTTTVVPFYHALLVCFSPKYFSIFNGYSFLIKYII